MKGGEIDVDVCSDPGGSCFVHWINHEEKPIGVVDCSYKVFTLAIRNTWDLVDGRPRWFLDENNIEL